MSIHTNLLGRTVKGGYSTTSQKIVGVFVDRGEPKLILENADGYLHDANLGNVQLEPETKMRRVVFLTPLRGNFARNRAYADACVADAIECGEAPMVLHFEIARVLDDKDPKLRELGIAICREFYSRGWDFVSCLDLGMTPGIDDDERYLWDSLSLTTERRLLACRFGITAEQLVSALDAGCVKRQAILEHAIGATA